MDVHGWQYWPEWEPPEVLIQVSFGDGIPVYTGFPSEFRAAAELAVRRYGYQPSGFFRTLHWRLTGIAKQRIEVA